MRVRSELHVSGLAHGLTVEVASKSLRAKLKPATAELSPSKLRKWQHLLGNTSLQLTQFILNDYETMSHSLRQEEEVLSQELRERQLVLLRASNPKRPPRYHKQNSVSFAEILFIAMTTRARILSCPNTNGCPQSGNAKENCTLNVINMPNTDVSPTQSSAGTNYPHESASESQKLHHPVCKLSAVY